MEGLSLVSKSPQLSHWGLLRTLGQIPRLRYLLPQDPFAIEPRALERLLYAHQQYVTTWLH